MAQRTQALIIPLVTAFCFAFQGRAETLLIQEPWFYPPFQFHIGTDVGVNFFSDVNYGVNPVGYSSTNVEWNLYAIAPFTDTFDAEVELSFWRTTKLDFNLESAVLQIRKQFLNDVQGDFVSLDGGLNYRLVPKRRLSDVATPYHNISNFELFLAAGKEFSKEYKWYMRTFLWAAVGQANKGYPWGKFNFNVKGKAYANYLLGGGAEGYFGAGGEKIINVNRFNSYANIKHRSLDLYAQFGYISQVWGSIIFRYTFRPYARSFPDEYNAFLLSFDYPFSF